jgi:hypothetical protein
MRPLRGRVSLGMVESPFLGFVAGETISVTGLPPPSNILSERIPLM